MSGVLVCPECGSDGVELHPTSEGEYLECPDCGWDDIDSEFDDYDY